MQLDKSTLNQIVNITREKKPLNATLFRNILSHEVVNCLQVLFDLLMLMDDEVKIDEEKNEQNFSEHVVLLNDEDPNWNVLFWEK